MAKGRRWTRSELLVVLNLYHKLRFGQLYARQPAVIAVAEKLERTANSLALKLVNLASLDPVLKLRGIKGMPKTSKFDRTIWDEFHQNLDESVLESECAFRQLFGVKDDCELELLPREGFRIRRMPEDRHTEAVASVKVRRGQEYFRDAVLNNFGERCGICGLEVRELLNASHILPWSKYPEERWNVCNGLCLSRLHDAAFDRHLISFDENLRLLLSPQLKAELPQQSVKKNFGAHEGETLHFPDDARLPHLEFLAEHRALFLAKAK